MFGEWKVNWWFFCLLIVTMEKEILLNFSDDFTHSEFISTNTAKFISSSCLYSNTDVSIHKDFSVPRDCLIISWKIISKCNKDIIHFLTSNKFTSLFTLSTLSLHITTLCETDQGLWCLRFIWLRRKLFKENCKLQIQH